MNILPKKSWHVRTRKNIERVRRDEAEAERLERIEQDRTLRVEQEARYRELRIRNDPGAAPESSGHINLFENPEDSQQITNKDHDDEKRQDELKSQQRAGLFNKLVRSEDANKPWYCQPKSDLIKDPSDHPTTSSGSRKRQISDLITSIYDPMTTMKHAEEIIRAKKTARREHERLRVSGGESEFPFNQRLHFQSPSHQQPKPFNPPPDDKNVPPNDSSGSSPEIVKVIERNNKYLDQSTSRRRHSKNESKKQRHKHKHRHKHRRKHKS